ncbi:MAG: TonB-dependent receptor [Gammaproteobacteria bacterium]|nr:TonB-dependent receptor [Gammaproteobacteria bacterium]
MIGFAAGVSVVLGATVSVAADAKRPAATVGSGGTATLEEIIVTARKRSENLRDIPASIVAIPETVLKEAHIAQLDDISGVVSNLNIFEAHDNSPAVTMRGVGAFEVVQGVGFYANDVQLFEGQTVRPNDVARIEVLKGPQGTLYGGANIGGAIKYVTKDPTPTWQNEASVELGQYSTWNLAAVLSGPISDKLGVRFSAYDDNHDGYIYDTYHQTTYGKGHDHGARLTFVYEPQAATRVRLAFSADDYSSQNQNLLYRVNPAVDPQFTAPYTANEYRYSVDDYFDPSFIRKIFSSTLQVDHQLTDNVALTSITSKFFSFNRGVTDFAKKPIPIDLLFQNADHRVYTEELRLASSGHSDLDWLVGAFAQYHGLQYTNSDWLYNADPSNPQIVGTDYDQQTKIQKQYAVFGDLTYHVGRWQMELGLRGEYYTSNAKAYNDQTPPPRDPHLTAPQLTGHQFSPRVSVQYKLSPQTNIYGTIARGFEPADLVEQNFQISAIRPEIATSYELGTKSQLPHGAQLTAAVFYIDYKDRLYNMMRLDPTLNIVEVETNIGPSRNYGAEVDFAVPLSNEFKLSGGIGTTKAIWGNAMYADPQLTAAAQVIDPAAAPVLRNLNGLTAPFTPEYSANLALEWTHSLVNGYKLGARIDGSAVGQSYWDPNDFAKQEPYRLLNVGAHLDGGNWTWAVHVSNLTGTKYNTIYWDAWDVGAPHSIGRINRPRTFVASGTFHF